MDDAAECSGNREFQNAVTNPVSGGTQILSVEAIASGCATFSPSDAEKEIEAERVKRSCVSCISWFKTSFQSSRFPTNQDFHKFFVGFGAGWRFTDDK